MPRLNYVDLSKLLLCFAILIGGGASQAQSAQSASTPAASASTASSAVAPAGANGTRIAEYKECLDNHGRLTFACGAKECPGGTKYLRTVKEDIPECNRSACVDMKAMGWKKGNKTRFCTDRGYDGVRPASKHDYSKGGCCFKNAN